MIAATVYSVDRVSIPNSGEHAWRVTFKPDVPTPLPGAGGPPLSQLAFYVSRWNDTPPLAYGDRISLPIMRENAKVQTPGGALRMRGWVFDPDHEPGLG